MKVPDKKIKKNRRYKFISFALAFVFISLRFAAFIPVYAESSERSFFEYNVLGDSEITVFEYIHDPSENPKVMEDIVRDETAVYGFRPSETGSLGMYASADWSDPEVVEQGRRDRIAYHESISAMYDTLADMKAQGISTEQIARTISAMRNQIRLDSYKDDPEGLAALKQRNLEKYGHEEGPLPDELYEQYGSWDTVLVKAFSVNMGMDACLGLYDEYYEVYKSLGQVFDKGDVDHDGKFNAKDVLAIMKYLVGCEPTDFDETLADFDGNARVNAHDVIALMSTIAEVS